MAPIASSSTVACVFPYYLTLGNWHTRLPFVFSFIFAAASRILWPHRFAGLQVQMKILGTIVLSVGAILGALLFVLLSSCALSRYANGYRPEYAVYALLAAAGTTAAIWAIARLHRK